MREYKQLNNQTISNGDFSIVPIRHEDMYPIMEWRNEQIYHLRQTKTLTVEDQEHYFCTTIRNLFLEEQPSQLLFSYLKNGNCIGYGGLVHINWTDKNAEISFIMKTELEQNQFAFHWHNYLYLIEKIAFEELSLHKIYTYAFDLRPQLYKTLDRANYLHEATLKEHCLFNNNFKDVVIHSKSKLNYELKRRNANSLDCDLLYKWTNDPLVRKLSFNSNTIDFNNHKAWFNTKMKSKDCYISIFTLDNLAAGQVRIEKDGNNAIIGISIDQEFRGMGLSPIMLKKATNTFFTNSKQDILAYIKPENKASIKAFETCGFKFNNTSSINDCIALEYRLKNNGNE